MSNIDFNLEEWIDRFPLKSVPDERCGGGAIAGPLRVAVIEQLRRLCRLDHDLGPSTPTDVFVFAIGEPERRDVTKVNGLPYRPAGKPWPRRPNGEPMTFLCQYRFTESKDFVGELPGDVLLVFVRDEDISPGGRESIFLYEWYPLGLSDLVGACDVPPPAWEFVKCYAVRHRSVDYLDKDELTTAKFERFIPAERMELYDRSAHDTSRWNAMKIGGLPVWFSDWNEQDAAARITGRFLCSLTHIIVSIDQPYPWINQPEPIRDQLGNLAADKKLLARDGFLLTFTIDDDGEVHWYIQFW